MKLKIITDNTSDISKEFALANDIEVLPLKVIFGDEEFIEGVNMTHEEFYQKLAASDALPTTSQVSPATFQEAFECALNDDSEVLGLFIASTMSGTYQSACIARDMIGSDAIHLIDTETVTFALGLLVEIAVQMRAEGKSAKEIAEYLEVTKKKVRLVAAVGTLDYLQKGGRMSAASAKIGTMLHIKPIVSVENGVINLVGKARGTKAAIKFIVDYVNKHDGHEELFHNFAHIQAPELCQELIEAIESETKYKNYTTITDIGCIVGTHTGPDSFGFCYVQK